MRAARFHRIGEPEVLVVEAIPTPAPKAGQVLLRMSAAGVNPADVKNRQGLFGDPPPTTVGAEGSGTVIAVGDGVGEWKVGDEVFGMVAGATAEYALAESGSIVSRPARISPIEAAGVTVNALTAWQSLFDIADLLPGERVLIHGAAGGVGSYAVQLARRHGATIMATASADDLEFVRELGADQVHDYRSGPFEAAFTPADVILDTVGGETTTRSLSALSAGGRLVSIVRMPEDARWKFHSMEVKPDQLQKVARLIEEGHLRPLPPKVFPLEKIADAHADLERGGSRTKRTIQLDGK